MRTVRSSPLLFVKYTSQTSSMQYFNALTSHVAELACLRHTWSETPNTGYLASHKNTIGTRKDKQQKAKNQSQQNHLLRTTSICKYGVNSFKLYGISHYFQLGQFLSVLRDCWVVFLNKRTFCKQTVTTCILWRLIWFCTVCIHICPT